jgi:hypothetical protein
MGTGAAILELLAIHVARGKSRGHHISCAASSRHVP